MHDSTQLSWTFSFSFLETQMNVTHRLSSVLNICKHDAKLKFTQLSDLISGKLTCDAKYILDAFKAC